MTHNPHWHLTILTLFPEMFPGSLGHSLAGKALENGIWSYDAVNIRDFGLTQHQMVDDTPYGGGAGMVIRADVLGNALDSIKNPGRMIYFSPRGKKLDQSLIADYISEPRLTLLCGRYEGIDQRILDHYPIEEVSIGDYILSGGEMAALSFMDAGVRLLPGVVHAEESLHHESFSGTYECLLEHPHYTRPAEWRGEGVPEVLRSGNHKKITQWQLEQAEALTQERRPDLWKTYNELMVKEE